LINLSFLYPIFFLLLLFLLCFIYCKIQAKTIYFSKIEWLPKSRFDFDKDIIILVVIYILIVIALASPFQNSKIQNSNKRGRDLVLVLDTSGSMAQGGFDSDDKFKSKYDISISIIQDFVTNRFDDNIGIVVFGTFAYISSPLTYDINALKEMLSIMSNVGIAGDSTAIGDAIFSAIDTLKNSKAQEKVIILLTDGHHNAGVKSPKDTVDLAQKKDIKIYTIGIGKKGDYDETLLKTIAEKTGAKFFNSDNKDSLKKIYKEIDTLEPSPISSLSNYQIDNLYIYPAILAIFLLLFLLLKDEDII